MEGSNAGDAPNEFGKRWVIATKLLLVEYQLVEAPRKLKGTRVVYPGKLVHISTELGY